jgi:DNA-binding CsgD family transcriptional regulator
MLNGSEPREPLAALIGRTTTPMLLADDDRRYVDLNEAACRLLERDRDELLGMRIDDLVGGEDVQRLWEAFIEEGEQAGRISLVTSGGEPVEVIYSATANVSPGRHLSVLVPVPMADAELDSSEVGAPATRSPVPLAPREREVLTLLALGRTGPQIASELGLSSETVRNYTRNARDKLGARTRAHAIALAVKLGQIQA